MSNAPGSDYYTLLRRDIEGAKGEPKDGNPKAASRALHAAGIKGIRYLDGSSRGKGEGSYNYVIFDDADVTILEANGKPVKGKAREDALEAMHREGQD
jgi:hypothetical protein